MTQQTAYFPLVGGLDLVTPPIQRPPGAAIAGQNYEPRPEGYRRIKGYERFDGRPLASAASYWKLAFAAGSAAFVAGQIVTGATSGATGEVLTAPTLATGSYGDGDAAGFVILTALTGAFVDGENLQVSAVTRAVADGAAAEKAATNDADDALWLHDAIETQRAKITAVPGSGPVRGIWRFQNAVYAFRDNADATTCVLHRATAAGWVAVDLGRSLAFTSGGVVVITEGQTITGATSGATATVARVVVESGDWTTGDAAGRLILSAQTGTFAAENLNVGASLNVATVAANSAAITLLPGGQYEFVTHNFYGAADRKRMYGCDGANRAFEFDGTVFVPIVTGMTLDKPTHIAAHRGHLFLAFAGGSVQLSGVGEPLSWQVITGAGEIALGDEVTGLLAGYAGSLVITCLNRLGVLLGTIFTGPDKDSELRIISEEAGAIRGTLQMMAQPTFLDQRGLRNLATTDQYGSFAAGTLSELIKPLFEKKREDGARVTCSVRIRESNQYRLFWDDGTALMADMSGKRASFFPLVYTGVTVRAASACECEISGNEFLFMATDDGFVYRMDSGTSFDGAPVEYFLRTAFNNLRSPTQNKRFHKATLEVNVKAGATTLSVAADFGYGNPDLPSVTSTDFNVYGAGGFWNEAVWNEFYWSQVEGTAEAYIDGFGTNVCFAFFGAATYEQPHILHGLTIHHSFRGLQR
jgi:hypothetical protein